MESCKILGIISTLLTLAIISVNGQISTPCTASMIGGFTPCINFITGSTNNGSSPSSSCCDALKSLMDASMDCACLIITASVPFQLPINLTLGILACNIGSIPGQCKAARAPLPSPGPVLFGPIPPPVAAPALSPRVSRASTTTLASSPETETNSPPSPPEAPKTAPRVRTMLTPPAAGAADLKNSPPTALLLILVLIMVF